MGITAISGPHVVYGLTRSSTGQVTEYNEERGASIYDCGWQIPDPRSPFVYGPGSAVGTQVPGWWGGYGVIDCAPGTVNSSAVGLAASNSTFASGTTVVLSSVSNSVVTIGVTMTPADGSSARTVIALDSTYATAPRRLTWGQSGTIASYDPTTALQRQLTITRAASVDDTAGTWTIQGFDQYGFKITETITGTSSTGGSQLTSRKTYKYIQSITGAGTLNSTNVAFGVNDTYGFPLAVHQAPYVDLWSGPSSGMNRMTAQSSIITFAATVTATATTADLRGTWASTIASNSTQAAPQRIFMRVIPSVNDVNAMSLTYGSSGRNAWLGFPEYSS